MKAKSKKVTCLVAKAHVLTKKKSLGKILQIFPVSRNWKFGRFHFAARPCSAGCKRTNKNTRDSKQISKEYKSGKIGCGRWNLHCTVIGQNKVEHSSQPITVWAIRHRVYYFPHTIKKHYLSIRLYKWRIVCLVISWDNNVNLAFCS